MLAGGLSEVILGMCCVMQGPARHGVLHTPQTSDGYILWGEVLAHLTVSCNTQTCGAGRLTLAVQGGSLQPGQQLP